MQRLTAALVTIAALISISAQAGRVQITDKATYDVATVNDGSLSVAATNIETKTNETGSVELLVNLEGRICTNNTTTSLLGIGGVFLGEWQDALDYGVVSVSIATDADSAVNGLCVQWSHNAAQINNTDDYSITGGNAKTFTFGPANRYLRIQYTNGGTAQTSMSIETSLRRVYVKPSSHKIQDPIIDEDDAELVKAVLTAKQDGDGFANINSTASGNLKVTDAESGLAIAKGDVANTSFVHKFGNAPDFDTADGIVTVWDGADDSDLAAMRYTYSATANIDSISSSSTGDVVDIEIQGLDASYNLVTQTNTLAGQVVQTLATPLIRVFRMKNLGAVDVAGRVYCYINGATVVTGRPTTASDLRAVIDDGNNQTLMAVFTIPAGFTGYMRDWYAATATDAPGVGTTVHVIHLDARKQGGVFQLKHKTSLISNGTSAYQHKYEEPQVFTEKTDIEMQASSSENTASVSAGFDIVLIAND